ncbi:HAMP domain-containing protein [Clostridium botulinum]|uniref:histidine kinase n=2 Tax=Clostridium botulinum TaxID=1491 RepID=A0A846HUN1_CLOBO|nr:ATP-binding protein [Clostridium botulinum]AJD27791.1 HAMP domain protein [Clostridium botulinum CDC_297]ACQ54139.1 sensor histidine kinase [Clostridium botulinum Ba4 str. 657]AJE11677.1 HAMP domain protein [Clostridium botulinum CDC_1436]APQ99188.1 HAMP domain protein [Clostridium botulinum]AUN02006.1 two-component sensor histidine kinase [Clostridium botulinum]
MSKISVKRRLMVNFILIIIISVFILEFLLIIFTRHYYYNNLEDAISNQIKTSAEFYNKYFSNSPLEDNVLDNVDVFWRQTSAQVQIIDTKGKVLMDSIGVSNKSQIKTSDIQKALKGEKGVWIGKVDYDTSGVMAVTYPLKSDNQIVGVLRFITSLRYVNSDIARISLGFLLIGLVVILISGLVSLFLANSITEPIKELTDVANKMASGNFKVKSEKMFDDEFGELSDTLNYMADEIVKKDQLKNEFISSVSHELRTPLTSIKGWAITLNSNEVDKEILKDGLKIIEDESERLSGMVEELLDFSKFVSGKMKLNKEEINICEIIDTVRKQLEPYAYRNRINFKATCINKLPNIYGDRNRIKQVLINLLDNAFKFTPEGGLVELNTKCEEEYITIVVKDTGVGINKEDLPRVKEKFYKGNSGKSKNGIGLSICDEIIKLHNGVLHIESEENKGTTISVKLPMIKL